MKNKREELIKRALLDKLNDSIDIYTADDILTVANIDETELTELRENIQADIDRLTNWRTTI